MVFFTYLKELTKNNLDFKALVLLNRKAGEGGSQESRSIKRDVNGANDPKWAEKKDNFFSIVKFSNSLVVQYTNVNSL